MTVLDAEEKRFGCPGADKSIAPLNRGACPMIRRCLWRNAHSDSAGPINASEV